MAITMDIGILCAACALFYMGTKTIGQSDLELKISQYTQLAGKWMFLTTALITAFELMGTYGSNTELVPVFGAFLILWLFLFILDMIMLIPRVADTLRKRAKR